MSATHKTTSGHTPNSSTTDESLLMAYRDHQDQESFAALVSRYERELYVYLCRFLGDATIAEDVFQRTFLQVHLKCNQYEPGRKVKPWIYRIATNQAIDFQRRNRRHRASSLHATVDSGEQARSMPIDLIVDPAPLPTANLDQREDQEWSRSAVRNLPNHLRCVIDLCYFQGLKCREVADTLSIPVGTVKSRLHAALKVLRKQWSQREPTAAL